ncbi:MAG: DUF1998 domain-containing protein [Dysgonamonadaceae bacterium]|jgi:hypothetical protein|nr:DUF1998 domain-containing protein [Dysgonamonadaceae bacterium]
MGQYEQIQTRKTISAYGGVGSIIETRDGALIIKNFDEWVFFEKIQEQFEEHNLINDSRFKNRLSKYFQQLEYLVKIPINELHSGYKLDNQFALLSARYFPEWFYCNTCHKFDHISNWKRHWDNQVDAKDKDNFYPPKCFNCYIKNQQRKKKFYDLEQVRFILTAPNGDIADIPWDRWAFYKKAKKEQKTDEDKEEIVSLGQIEVPEDIVMEYKTSDKLDDLKGIGICVKNSRGEQLTYSTLSGLFNSRIKIQDLIPNTQEIDILFKPVIRSSNSVYYPNILSSIFIPNEDELNSFKINLIKDLYSKGLHADIISSVIQTTNKLNITPEVIQRLIDNNFSSRESEISKSENEYRFDEYKFITTKIVEEIGGELIFNKIDDALFQKDLIQSIYKMDKIKITFAQTSYTRQEPISVDTFLTDNVIKNFTSNYGKDTRYLPAVESFGEGIFFDFDIDVLTKWLNENDTISSRINLIVRNLSNSEYQIKKPEEITPQFVLIHTFSHLIIKELEYLCGYPSTSIQERLYIDDKLGMYGVLIYTIAGTEGSYGGITSLCDSDKIGKLINSAMVRACDCATDPICYHTSGQGVGNLNLSACFSCTLLPETSCEMFNCFLDRRLLVDKEYGYFKNQI